MKYEWMNLRTLLEFMFFGVVGALSSLWSEKKSNSLISLLSSIELKPPLGIIIYRLLMNLFSLQRWKSQTTETKTSYLTVTTMAEGGDDEGFSLSKKKTREKAAAVGSAVNQMRASWRVTTRVVFLRGNRSVNVHIGGFISLSCAQSFLFWRTAVHVCVIEWSTLTAKFRV